MKAYKKVCLILALIISLCVVNSAYAAVQDGIEITITSNKTSYSIGDTAQLTIRVRNTNSFTVNDIVIEDAIPTGLTQIGAKILPTRINLVAGGEASFTVSIVVTASITPHTGDSSKLFLWFIIAILGAVTIFLIIKHQIKHKNKEKKASITGTKFFCWIVCLVMILPIMPNIAFAASSPHTLKETKTLIFGNSSFSYTVSLRLGVPFTLSVDNSIILIGTDSNWLTFYLETDITAASVPLYMATESTNYSLVGQMFDDGDYDSHGDDMAGDGVYSIKFYSTAVQDLAYSFIAKYGDEISNYVIIKCFTELTNEELDSIISVDNKIENLITSSGFISGTEEQRKELVDNLLADLASSGKIEGDSILFSDLSGVYSFQYTAGSILGGVMIREFKPDFNGTDNNAIATDTLTYDEKQKLWEARQSANPVPVLQSVPSSFSVSSFSMMSLSTFSIQENTRTAIILNSFPAFETLPSNINYRTQFYEDLRTEWNGKGLQTTLDTSVTIEDYKNLEGYDIIILATHGYTEEWNSGFLWLTHNRFPAICLAQLSTKNLDKQYSVELKDKQIVKLTRKNGDTIYCLLPAFFENTYGSSDLDNTFIFSESCEFMGKEGNVDYSMAQAFLNISVETVVGFHNSVLADYSRDFMATYIDRLIAEDTTQNAFNHTKSVLGADHKIWWEDTYGSGTYPSSRPIAYPILNGRTDAQLKYTQFQNGGFENNADGKPESWSCYGDVRVVTFLGDIDPIGFLNTRMAFISTGVGSGTTATIGSGTEGSMISQTIYIPDGCSTLTFYYNFVSEEPMEYVGSIFNDAFAIQLKQGTTVKHNEILESINTSTWYNVGGIDFYGGDQTVYQTQWKKATLNISAYNGQTITFSFIVYDVGDTIYDSVCLIDNVSIQ